jgi:hypothetical protein
MNILRSYCDNLKSYINTDDKSKKFTERKNISSSSKENYSKVLKCFNRIVKSTLEAFRGNDSNKERVSEAYRTQEHLFRVSSRVSFHVEKLISYASGQDESNFVQLTTELQKMKKVSEVSGVDLANLKENESLWVNGLGGYHAMMIRITKTSNGNFDFQFSNTGMGLSNHETFHPCKIVNGKRKYQTVALIKDIPPENFNNFFQDYAKIARTPIDVDNNDQLIKVNNKLYELIGKLGKPVNLKDEPNTSRYYSREQVGGSCTASSIFAMSKIILDPDQQKKLKTDLRTESLLHQYNKIKSGKEVSTTLKLQSLDLIQKLRADYKKGEAPELLSKIENELKAELKIINVEVLLEKGSKESLEKYAVKNPNDSNGINLTPAIAKINKRKDKLTGNVEMKVISNHQNYINYHVSQTASGRYQGTDMLDKAYLLYYQVATGNQEESYHQLSELMNSLMSDSNQLSGSSLDKSLQTANLLFELANQFQNIDNTRSGIAKTMFLYELALAIMNKGVSPYINDLSDVRKAEVDKLRNDLYVHGNFQTRKYNSLNVEKYLPRDHVWVQRHKDIQNVLISTSPKTI